jgi:hypothetical protein
MNKRKLKFWTLVANFAKKRQSSAYLEGGGCDSCCPRCKQFESQGNTIYTRTHPDDSYAELRTCVNCGYEWKSVFTPVGFVPVE